jgi:hypothetical protein
MSRFHCSRALVFLCGVFLLHIAVANRVWAQSATATLKGTITDENNKPVKGAKITVTDTRTNETHETTSDQDGNYQLSGLVTDKHEVKVESPGHKRRRYPGILLKSGETTTLDVKLELGPPSGSGSRSGLSAGCSGPHFEAGLGYVYGHVHSHNGFEGYFSAPAGPISIEANSSMTFSSSSTVNRRISWLSAGPRFRLPGSCKVTPWVHAIYGVIWRHDTDKLPPNIVVAEHGFLMRYGGGVDVSINRWVSWNIVTFDYFMTRVQGSTGNTFALKSGIAFKFGFR